MRKIRILHIIANFGTGGAQRLLVNLLESYNRKRFEVAAVSLYPPSKTILEYEITDKKLEVYFLNKHRGLDLRIIPQLYHLLRAFRPDVVHTHLSVLRYSLLPILLCQIPVRVHTVQNIAQKEVDLAGKLVHWFAFHLSGVVPVSISQEVANTIHSLYGRGVKTPIIYNAIPTAQFIYNQKRINKQSDKNLVILHIGRFSPQKNHIILIDAFALALKENNKMYLWLVGDGELREIIKDLVSKKGLEEKISFLGLRSDIAMLLADSDLFVLSSDYEGLPIVILEAMAAGKPVIATAVGGVPELVEDGITGILVPPRDPESLSQAILRLAKDPDLRHRMGQMGQKNALERFDISLAIRKYEALYLKLLKECGRI